MADWRINEKYRKPRKTKGTPFYIQRNYYALAVLGFGAVSWYIYELWPLARKLKHRQEEIFKTPDGMLMKIKHIQASLESPTTEVLLAKAREKEADKYEDNSSKNTQISISFSSTKSKEDFSSRQKSESFDSPYKKSLGEIKNMSLNDDKDFRTPKPIKVQKRTRGKTMGVKSQNKSKPKSKTSKAKSTMKNSLFRTIKNFEQTDVNPDHLQMAIALSNSTYALEYPDKLKDEDSFPTFLTPEKIPKGKTTLERYGFKSGKTILHTEFKRESSEAPKRNKNSKFRFITPTLKIRTVEERQSIIASKIALILSSNSKVCETLEECETSVELYSDILKKLQRSSLMFTNSTLHVMESDEYYVKNLNIPHTRSKCGCLLKKWEDIPGRDKSPTRKEIMCEETEAAIVYSTEEKLHFLVDKEERGSCAIKNVESNSSFPYRNLSVDYSTNRDCISPDLFESDSEAEYALKSSEEMDNFSESLLSPLKKSSNCEETNHKGCKTSTITFSESKTDLPSAIYKNDVISKDEDTEELYTKSLQLSKEAVPSAGTINTDKVVVMEFHEMSTSSNDSTIQVSTLNKQDTIDEDEDTEELYIKSLQLSKENSQSKNMMPNDKSEVTVDLTLSSSNDSTDFLEKTTNKNYASEQSDIKRTNTEDVNINFEMSPLFLKNSNSIPGNNQNEQICELQTCTINEGPVVNRHSRSSLENSAALNVTDYVMQILNQDNSKILKGEETTDDCFLNECSLQHCSSNNTKTSREVCLTSTEDTHPKDNSGDIDNELVSSQGSCSHESISISDEELNYSSIHSKNVEYNFYSLSDNEEVPESGNNFELMAIDDVNNIHAILKNKYGNKQISTPVHNRVSELRSTSPLPKMSLTKAFLEDSFNITENSEIIKALDGESDEATALANNQPTVKSSPETKHTPEKTLEVLVAPTNNTETTPDNNLIIKTKNITPLTNYDEMDTPGITSELQKFGLKPLKRQRGAKMLKYIYESTHPWVGPDDIKELSSDEDDRNRVVKKRKKIKNTKQGLDLPAIARSNCNESNIEIVGDTIIRNENVDDLIFERKYSAKIPSCRIPLQIVWHNFLSENSHIRENILLYEPLQLEVLHTLIKEQSGCKFHIQDLLTFCDKKCITIRTAQGSQKPKKKM